jgi:hypothetical protein
VVSQVNAKNLRLWNGSWADDSVRWDVVNRVAYEPSRIKKIEHSGKYSGRWIVKTLLISYPGPHLKLSAHHQLHPSPQRTPVIFQAGTSKPGMALRQDMQRQFTSAVWYHHKLHHKLKFVLQS